MRQDVLSKVERIVGWLDASYFLTRRHRAPIRWRGYLGPSWAVQSRFASSFASRELRDGLGGSRADYKRYLRLYWSFPEHNEAYEWDLHVTKPYLLTPRALEVLTGFWRGNGLVRVKDEPTGRTLERAHLPPNGVVATSYSSVRVPSLVRFEMGHLDAIIASVEAEAGLHGAGLPLDKRFHHVVALRWLYAVRQWTRAIGGVPNLYRDFAVEPTSGNGRLFGIGGMHLQRLQRSARKLLYKGTGWWDFDFKACHPHILLSLAEANGEDMPCLRDYLQNRSTRSQRMAEELEIPAKKIKRLLNGMIYGQKPSTSPRSTMMKLLKSEEAVERVRTNVYYLTIRNEIQDVREDIIERHTKADSVVNAVGKVRPRFDTTTGKLVAPSKLLSHILTGYEAWALDVVCREYDDVLVLMHDGFVSQNDRDVSALEGQVQGESRRQFGFALRLALRGDLL